MHCGRHACLSIRVNLAPRTADTTVLMPADLSGSAALMAALPTMTEPQRTNLPPWRPFMLLLVLARQTLALWMLSTVSNSV